MSAPNSRVIRLELNANHAELLTGLDTLLRLGLLNDEQVRRLGRSQLFCPLPETVLALETPVMIPPLAPIPVVKIPVIPTIFSRFFDELSVRWLLFLGVFLVVLSAGVLVASQWSNFPSVGQYLVLWGYTITFGYVGFWATHQKDLKLTATSLQTVAMLLVPFNFWAIDEFHIWQSIGQSLVAIAAIIVLSMGVSLFTASRHWSKAMLMGFLSLGLLHWQGEFIFDFALRIYLGIGIIIIILWGIPFLNKSFHSPIYGWEFVLFGLGVLLFRAIAVAGVPIGTLGLGIGALGWLCTQLTPHHSPIHREVQPVQTSKSFIGQAIAYPWETAGACLMSLGWLVTVGRYDWQVLGISVLAMVWLLQKLRRHWQLTDLIALFVVGLQGGILLGNVMPSTLKTSVTTAAVEFSQAQNFPYAIYSITLIPYLLIWAIAAIWLYRKQQQKLAQGSEYLVLSLNIILASLSIPNATWRALNLSISALVWFYFTEYSRPYLRKKYLYLTHGIGLLALGGMIERFFPHLSLIIWGIVCLLGMLLEWSFYLIKYQNNDASHRQIWQQSSWYYGVYLAIASFILLLISPLQIGHPLRLIWLIAPGAATYLAIQKRKKWRRYAVIFSIISLIVLSLFGSGTSEVLVTDLSSLVLYNQIGLAIALGLMFFNVKLMPSNITVYIHLSYSVALIVSLVAPKINNWQWLIIGALGAGLYWGVAFYLQGKRRYLNNIYRRACHQWGLICGGFTALILLQHNQHIWTIGRDYVGEIDHLNILISSILLLAIVLFKYWQNLQNEALIIGGIALETVLVESCVIADTSAMAIASGNLCFASLFFYYQNKTKTLNIIQLSSLWRAYPLLFILLGFAWRLNLFNALTGLVMIAIGILLFACTTLYPKVVFLRFIGFVSVTVGCYETVIYHMLQSPGGNYGDAWTILAFVAIGLALIYRILYWFWSRKNTTKIASIPLNEVLTAAHVHWAIAVGCKLFTLPYFQGDPPTLKTMAIAINICLAIYAFIQANQQTPNDNSKWSQWWIYVGAMELVLTSIQARWMWQQLASLDPLRAFLVSLLALIIFQLPWKNMGWQETPWHRVGIAMPALCLVMTTSPEVSYLSLASVTLVYLRIAQKQSNIRWGYLSLIFGNWLVGKTLFQFNLLQPLSYALQIGLTILFIAQVDPDFQRGKRRLLRHRLRLIGSGIIGVMALIYYQQFGITPAVISFALIFLGLGLHTRAFLYNGTIILVITGIYQLVILIDSYSFAKWIIGLMLGILLISIAANFEQRRLQLTTMIQGWMKELDNWE